MSTADIASVMGVNLSSVKRWKRAFRTRGAPWSRSSVRGVPETGFRNLTSPACSSARKRRRTKRESCSSPSRTGSHPAAGPLQRIGRRQTKPLIAAVCSRRRRGTSKHSTVSRAFGRFDYDVQFRSGILTLLDELRIDLEGQRGGRDFTARIGCAGCGHRAVRCRRRSQMSRRRQVQAKRSGSRRR